MPDKPKAKKNWVRFNEKWERAWALIAAGVKFAKVAAELKVDKRTVVRWAENPHYMEGLELACKLHIREAAKRGVRQLADEDRGDEDRAPVNLMDRLERKTS